MAATRGHSRVEELTRRAVVIETDEVKAHGLFLEQEGSPLFALLPREIRDMIWELVLAQFEDTQHKFEATEYFCRPGHTARLRTDYRLLLTCRRIWLEAHAMPMLQAEQSFYYHRAAPDARNPAWMGTLTAKNLRDFGYLHLYCQMYAVEERLTVTPGALRGLFLNTALVLGDFQPRVLHVTLRHTDFYYWENDEPLRLQDRWVKALLNTPDLRSTETLKLEMETLDYKVDQLEAILERVKSFTSEEMFTHVIDGKPTKTKFVLVDKPATYDWEGPANINKRQYGPYQGKDKLKYHVITLTWKLKFPEIPGAFVPRLRREARIDPLNISKVTGKVITHPKHHEVGQSQKLLHRQVRLCHRREVAPGVQFARYDIARRRFAVRHPGSPWPANIDTFRDMQLRVRTNAQDLDQATEQDRRWLFESMMGEVEARKWQAKWDSEGSLLRFAE